MGLEEIIAESRRLVDALDLVEVVGNALEDARYDNDYDDCRALAVALRGGQVVQARRVEFTAAFAEPGRFSGRDEHRHLCSCAAAWLDAAGRKWVSDCTGLRCPDGIADIRTVDGRLAVEVGHTRAHKVLACLDAGLEVLLVPYITGGRFGILLSPLPGHEHLLDKERADKAAVAQERGLDPFADLETIYARADARYPF